MCLVAGFLFVCVGGWAVSKVSLGSGRLGGARLENDHTFSQIVGNDMSGSHRYLGALESLQELFVNYPFRVEMSSIHIAMDSAGQASIVVQLHKTDPVILAAGIVEWRRTLANGSTWAWRTPSGKEIHVATTGYAPECDETPMAVMAGPIPHDCYLDFDLDPDVPAELGDYTLYHWLGNEIANDWPFKPAWNRLSTRSGATS